MKKNYIFLLVVSLISATLASQTPYDSFAPESTRPMLDNSFSSAEVTAIEQAFKQSDAVDFQWGSFSLLADPGTLVHDLPFSFALIPNGGEHRMPSYMVNVTGENVGAYRLLPNGVHFSEPATIAVPYDDFLLPMGYNPKDIKTYYFDEELAQWKELQRISVDTAQHIILSNTTHFTEFANAVIKLPEVPEMKAFVPTAMQDLPDVNPLQGIPMIAAPTANNRGTAELTYPIELPPGRNGMQPNIDLHYSSAGGNDILGVGWSITQPAITIDTRWGVPRNDERWETEAYLLNGEQIVLHESNNTPIPLPHQAGERGFERRKFGVVQYFARDTKNQDRIVRHGDDLKHIWWDVVDRNGTKFYYGYDPINPNNSENAIVRTADSAIVYWALTATMDVYGNYMQYFYQKDNNEVYLDSIKYTGHWNSGITISPYYTIQFRYNHYRSDPIINGRLGVLQKKYYLLNCITIVHNQLAISQYKMDYGICNEQTLYKTRLDSITKYDEPWCLDCNPHYPNNSTDHEWDDTYGYLYNHGVNSANNLVGALGNGTKESVPGSKTEFRYQDAKSIDSIFSITSDLQLKERFSKSTNQSWSIGGTATVGLGNIPALTTLSLGGNYSYNRGTGAVESMMMDIDADGLPDLVCLHDTIVYYYKQFPSGEFSDTIRIPGLDALSREISDSHTFGVQVDLGASFSYNPSINDSYTDIYFTDVNGDGLPDQITPDGIKFNRLNNGRPYFTTWDPTIPMKVSNSPCGYVYRTEEVDMRLECQNFWDSVTIVNRNDLLVYEGPYHGESPINMSNQGERPNFSLSNNIANTTSRETEFYELAKIEPITSSTYVDDGMPSFNEPVSRTGYGQTKVLNIPTEWLSSDYRIVHRGDSLVIYHLETVCPESSDLPNVDIVRVWVAPHEGTIRITSDIHLKRDSSDSRLMSRKADGVKYYIQQNQLQRNPEYYIDILAQGTIPANCTDTIHSVINSVSVQANDVFFFRLSANKNRRFDDTEWTQTIQYTSGGTDVYNSANDYVCTGNKDFTAPCEGSVVAGYTLENNQSATFTVKIKQNGSDLMTSNQQISIPWVNVGDVISFEVEYDINNSAEPKWSDIHIHPYVIFSNSSQDGSCSEITGNLTYYPDVHIPATSIIANESDNLRQLFGLLHKGWGQFAYNNIYNATIIDILNLNNKESQLSSQIRNDSASIRGLVSQLDTTEIRLNAQSGTIHNSAQSMINSANTYNPIGSGGWIAMHADSRTENWIAYGNLGAIGNKLHSTSIQLDTMLVCQDSLLTDIVYDSAIPIGTTGGMRVTTIRKKNSSVQHCLSFSVPFANTNLSFGTHDIGMDYVDMNGDGFPDFVSSTSIQYSTPWGGLDSTVCPTMVQMGHNETFSQGAGFSGGKEIAQRIPSNRMRNVNTFNTALNGGGSISYTLNHGHMTCMDMNADGLPDLVNKTKDSVWYNLGYTFSAGERINGITINEGFSACESLSGTLGFSISQYSISGGVSQSASVNTSSERMIDINGDGLPDKLYKDNSGVWKVMALTNEQLEPQQSTNRSFSLASTTNNIGINAGVTAGVSFGMIPIKLCFGVQTTPWSTSTTYGNGELIDINGDGFVDYIQDSILNNTNIYSVCYNQNGLVPVNLLTSVTNPTGQILKIEYEQTTPSVAQRGRSWVLANVQDSILAYDDSQKRSYKFTYSSPYHDNFEKTDYGFSTVTTNDNNTKKIIESYDNWDFIGKGEKIRDLLTDMANHPYIGHIHKKGYMLANGDPVQSVCNDAAVFVAQDQYDTEYYEGQSTPVIVTSYELERDTFYNVTVRRDLGDINVAGDEWTQTITYYHGTHGQWHRNLISLPIQETITSGSTTLRQNRAEYNYFGRPRWLHSDETSSSDTANTYLGYDCYGNLAEVRFPYDNNISGGGHNAWLKIGYDNVTHSLPSSIFNQFLEHQYTLYDHRWGRPTMVIDPSGNAIQYDYDSLGRLVNVLAPRDYLESDEPYSVHYSYRIRGHELKPNIPLHSQYSYVIKVGLADGTFQAQSTIYDQRGHEKQQKRLSTVNNSLEWVADGVTEFDAFYNPLRKHLPFISSETIGVWDDNPTLPDVMIMTYDVLDRITSLQNYDNTNKYWDYGFGKDCKNSFRLQTSIIDENGNTSFVLKSPQDWTMQTITPDGHSTCYEYNPIGERTKVTDADGYETTYTYNTWGNMTGRNHPDAGITTWTYAPAGNVLTMQTNELQQNSQFIEYAYDYGRLKEIHYPEFTENDVTYYYDCAGRIRFREDGVGSEELMYDELGNVKRSYRRVLVPTANYVYFFATRHKYDSFGKIQHIIYPDQDSVAYNYLPTGELSAVVHKPTGIGSALQTIVSNIEYDEYGHKVHQSYGNQVETDYSYSPLRQWMTQLETRLPSSGPNIQELYYTYDDVGNITTIEQYASAYSGLGGSYHNEYTYDHQYRLVSALGTSSNNLGYNFSMSYSPSGRIWHNSCGAPIVNKQVAYGYDDGFLTHQPRVVYDTVASKSYNLYWDLNGNLQEISNCNSENVRFHSWDEENRLRAVIGLKSAGLYGYDGNGNRVWKLTGDCRLESQNGGEQEYSAYLDDAVLYPNPYLTITPQGYTKHYYLGSERIATALGEGGLRPSPDNWDQREKDLVKDYWNHFKGYEPFGAVEDYKTTNVDVADNYPTKLQYGCPPFQLSYLQLAGYDMFSSCMNTYSNSTGLPESTFYTHSDHLGSASWITDFHGDPVQYIHYAPYGELLASQHAYGSSYDERYKFTGKERDAESGYDYYGARYQIVPLGIWGSPDPLLDKYIYISPYMYCNGNPIVLKDPDGRWVHVVVGAGVGAIVGACIALNSGKSGQDVGIAALGGAVAGTITAVTGGLGGSSIVLSTLFGTGGGMIGGAAGNLTEQGMKIALGSQSSVDVDEVGSATVAGAVAGAVGGLAKGLISKGAGALKQIVGKNYKNPSVEKSFKKKVATELKSSGKKASAKSVNKIAAERMENSQKIDEVIIDGTKEYLNVVNQVSTTNIENDIKN